MAVSVETAKREMSGALIEAFKLRAAPHIAKVEGCNCMAELRIAIFAVIDSLRYKEPDKAKLLMVAWSALDEA